MFLTRGVSPTVSVPPRPVRLRAVQKGMGAYCGMGMYPARARMGKYVGKYVGSLGDDSSDSDSGDDVSVTTVQSIAPDEGVYVPPPLVTSQIDVTPVTAAPSSSSSTSFSDITSAIAAGAAAISTVATAADLISVNAARAKLGLPPLSNSAITGSTTSSSTGFSLSLPMMLLIGGVALVFLLKK